MASLRPLIARVTPLEWAVALVVAVVMLVLVVLEPDIVEAPIENGQTIAFTVGGTVLAAAALLAMLHFDAPAPVRMAVLWVPFAAVNWWLLSPFFVDEVVDERFSTSIEAAPMAADRPTAEQPGSPNTGEASAEPVLLASGAFVGLAGHSGTGDAGLFRLPDGAYLVRFENFDIQNGPDLEVYLVPGADRRDLAPGAIHLGPLKGNVGNQSYELPPGTELEPGPYTALVWCEAFSVEFVGATLTIT